MNPPKSHAPRLALAALLVVLLVVGATFRPVVGAVRLGLEFRGGYEMLYLARPKTTGAAPVDRAALLQTVHQLEARAQGAGVHEPDLRLEGTDQIRVRLPGVVSDADAKAMMRDPGGLPVTLVEKYSQTVGGQLGDDSLTETRRAAALAVGAVALLLVCLYRLPGLIAVVGLLLYLWLMAAAFVGLHLTLSLSGVVALVLGVGLAADANIIIYERFREARVRGEDRGRAAVEAVVLGGRAILEANAAALVAAGVLFFSGIAPIQAFAETMLLSLVASGLTNLVFTSGLLLCFALSPSVPDVLFGWPRSAPAPAAGGSNGTEPGPLRILRFRAAFLTLALLAIVAGAVSLRTTPLNLDIDFKAGTMLDLKAEKPVTQAQATAIILGTGVAPDGVTVAGSPPTKVTARFENLLDGAQLARIAAAFEPAYGPTISYEENTADPTVAREFVARSVGCLLLTATLVAALVAWRFGWRSAVGASVAMGFSCFFVLGFFSLTHQEIDLTFVAAVLTVLTYTINECVIVFDRIRENLRMAVVVDGEDVWALADRSLRQTIRRSLLTVLTLVVGTVSLYFLGAEPLQMFALAVFVGLLAATFASVGLATPIWAWLTGGRPHGSPWPAAWAPRGKLTATKA